jgi:hypothetical protein
VVSTTLRLLYLRESKDLVPIVQGARLDSTENLTLPGFDPQTVQFMTSHFTGYTVMALFTNISENSVGKLDSTHL